jgi:hypothetical protein
MISKTVFPLTSLAIVALIGCLIAQNWYTSIPITFLSQHWPSMMVGPVLLGTTLFSALAVFLRQLSVTRQFQSEMKQWELRREKAEVKAETSTDQIRVLESKIQTLEKALQQALSSKTTDR